MPEVNNGTFNFVSILIWYFESGEIRSYIGSGRLYFTVGDEPLGTKSCRQKVVGSREPACGACRSYEALISYQRVIIFCSQGLLEQGGNH